jgi:hypothetical protein
VSEQSIDDCTFKELFAEIKQLRVLLAKANPKATLYTSSWSSVYSKCDYCGGTNKYCQDYKPKSSIQSQEAVSVQTG